MPTHPLPTVGTMILLGRPLWNELVAELGPQAAKAALQSCERLICGLFPTISGPCDKQDFSSASEVLSDGQAAIYLYDMVYDGVDLTTTAFDHLSDLVVKGLERLASCECSTDEGCFRCIANPRYPEPSSKRSSERLLKVIYAVLSKVAPHITHNRFESPIEPVESLSIECVACKTVVTVTDRFCRNCGEKVEGSK